MKLQVVPKEADGRFECLVCGDPLSPGPYAEIWSEDGRLLLGKICGLCAYQGADYIRESVSRWIGRWAIEFSDRIVAAQTLNQYIGKVKFPESLLAAGEQEWKEIQATM